MKSRSVPFVILAVVACSSPAPRCAAAGEPGTIRFSDPARPGTVKVILARGNLQLQGADTADVTVQSDAKPAAKTPRKDGLRVLSAATGFTLSERDNVVTLDAAASAGTSRGGADFRVTVPRNSAVIVQNSWGGNITCTGVGGDIEINSMQGEVHLEDAGGGVVVSTMNGKIRANIRELHGGKPLSFTSMNGEVQVRLPLDAKAHVRLRTQNGTVLTDFDETALVTKTESAPGLHRSPRPMTPKGGKLFGPEMHEARREAAQANATAVKEAVTAAREGVESARQGAEDARRGADEAHEAADRARAEAVRERARSKADGDNRTADVAPPSPPAPPKAPLPPRLPTIPLISGGQLVTGTLNGGGPEISVSTMNGDVVLRKR